MKKQILFSAMMVFFSIGIMSAQGNRGDNRRGEPTASSGYYDDDGYRDVTYRTYSRSYDDRRRGNRYDRYNERYYRYYEDMTRRDRKRLRELTEKLEYRKYKAWQDGRLSYRDRRRINDVQLDIDRLISRYIRPSRGYRSRSVCR